MCVLRVLGLVHDHQITDEDTGANHAVADRPGDERLGGVDHQQLV